MKLSIKHFLHPVDPTGVLIDSARKLVLPFIPEVTVEERREALIRVSKLALARGVTTILDFGRYYPGESVKLSWEDFSGKFCMVLLWMAMLNLCFLCQKIASSGLIFILACFSLPPQMSTYTAVELAIVRYDFLSLLSIFM